jgi:hypothetical protein
MSEGSRSCGCLVETNRVLHVPNESGGTNDIPCEDWCVTHDTRHIDCELKETLHALHHHTDCNAAQKERELVKLYREKSLELADLLGRHAAHIRELMQQYDLNSSAGKGTDKGGHSGLSDGPDSDRGRLETDAPAVKESWGHLGDPYQSGPGGE